MVSEKGLLVNNLHLPQEEKMRYAVYVKHDPPYKSYYYCPICFEHIEPCLYGSNGRKYIVNFCPTCGRQISFDEKH